MDSMRRCIYKDKTDNTSNVNTLIGNIYTYNFNYHYTYDYNELSNLVLTFNLLHLLHTTGEFYGNYGNYAVDNIIQTELNDIERRTCQYHFVDNIYTTLQRQIFQKILKYEQCEKFLLSIMPDFILKDNILKYIIERYPTVAHDYIILGNFKISQNDIQSYMQTYDEFVIENGLLIEPDTPVDKEKLKEYYRNKKNYGGGNNVVIGSSAFTTNNTSHINTVIGYSPM